MKEAGNEAWGMGSFDPLAAMPFDLDGDDYWPEAGPPIVEPDPDEKPAPRPELPPRKRIEALIKGMPGYKKLIFHILDFCREERLLSELVDEILAFQKGSISVYSPEVICLNLEKAGAIAVVAGDEAASEGAEEEGEFLSVEPCVDFGYVTTEDGLAVVDEDDPAARLAEFLNDDAAYMPVYAIMLSECLAAGELGKKAIDALVDDHPLCQNPRLYSGHFLKKLEGVEAMEFAGSWRITETGKKLLESCGFESLA